MTVQTRLKRWTPAGRLSYYDLAMKYRYFIVLIGVLAVGGLWAQESQPQAAFTLNGASGVIIVPDAGVVWERANIGLDMGYGLVWSGHRRLDHLPRFALGFARRAEISGLLHAVDRDGIKNAVIGAKVQLFREGGAALAFGGDFEIANFSIYSANSSKIYLALTYGGSFFKTPAVTTATLGWQFLHSGVFGSQFVYGMGFAMSLFPEVFKGYVFWITDFSNFSYTVYAPKVSAVARGAFNTGLRIHPIKDGRFKLVVDFVGTDLLDHTRGLSFTVSGGFSFS